MRIAVASGKGGTGKTTVATSLALCLAADGRAPLFLDCDVEAPNAHLFLTPTFERSSDVGVLIPQVDAERCTACGRCAEVCQYHAIAVLGQKVLVFSQLCHACGSCREQCPEDAITEVPSILGVLEAGPAKRGIAFARGVLNVGEPMAGPVIRQLKRWASPADGQIVILDAPPGTACPVVESIRGSDFLLLVTEPTPFGLHDLKLALQVGRELDTPLGVVINRDGVGDSNVEQFCRREDLPVLLRIPFERAVAEGTARGQTLLEIRPEYVSRLQAVLEQIESRGGAHP
jgi:MinD superfamily P-loop ATPase